MRHDAIDPGSAACAECQSVRPAAMTTAAFERWLDDLRRRSLATATAGDLELATLGEREPGDAEDDAPRLLAVGVLSDVITRERRELGEIAAARTRLARGTFGTCERCGARIGRRRLEAVPTTRHCLACQNEEEA